MITNVFYIFVFLKIIAIEKTFNSTAFCFLIQMHKLDKIKNEKPSSTNFLLVSMLEVEYFI